MTSAAEYIARGDVDAVTRLKRATMRRAERARTDPKAFFEFVMREENTGAPLKLMPHQRVALDFILAHDKTVNIWPVGHSKTYMMTALTLFLLGTDPSARGAIVSAKEGIAAKVLSVVRRYIETSEELHAVFPDLSQSPRPGDPWTQSAITVKRANIAKDPSLVAIGVDGQIVGSRIKWLVVDDLLDPENTRTPEQRQHVCEWFDSACMSRLDPTGGRAVVTNTPWHPGDLVHRLERRPNSDHGDKQGLGWAALRMTIDGDISIQDDENERLMRQEFGLPWEPWDSDELRPAWPSSGASECRLVAHDPDPENRVRLWPERFTDEVVYKLQHGNHSTIEYNRLFRCMCRADETAMCKQEYIDKCLRLAREAGVYTMVHHYAGPNPVFLGLDLAISPGEEHDDTCFFTFEQYPTGVRRILDIDVGQWDGPTILKKLFDKVERYKVSCARVENNGAQDFIIQFALDKNRAIPVKAHMTGRAKAHPEHGVPGFFLELENGAWLIPNDKYGQKHPAIERLCDACLYYMPTKHTDDVLMANYFAREQAKVWGFGARPNDLAGGGGAGNIGASIMSR